ncbi:MAG TPA: hypothetical protein VFW87_25085, partial [Pirellulales bacterium]|nr:hypothetical protein [Pirellulales bacterium]
MPNAKSPTRTTAALACVAIALFLVGAAAQAQTLTWGVNGAGGSGTWNTSTANWFNGAQNVKWASGADAIFSGASGGEVTPSGPVVTSMTFNQPGYLFKSGWIDSGINGLTVTTNVDATINSSLHSGVGDFLVKNGPAALILGGHCDLAQVQLNQGELRLTGNGSLSGSLSLADSPGASVTFGQSSSNVYLDGLAGGGTSGGVVRPDNQARTVSLSIDAGDTFGGVLQDNGSGILAVSISSPTGDPVQTFTNANTYSGLTRVFGKLALSGNGSALNSPMSIDGTLTLDNGSGVSADRLSDSLPISMRHGDIELKGNNATAVEEVAGPLTISSVSRITVTQPGSAAAQLSFASVQRTGQAILNLVGEGVGIAGLSNDSSGIVAPFITMGNEWTTVGVDGRITTFNGYTPDVNAGAPSDHVKLSGSGTTVLTAPTTRASMNMQNASAAG